MSTQTPLEEVWADCKNQSKELGTATHSKLAITNMSSELARALCTCGFVENSIPNEPKAK